MRVQVLTDPAEFQKRAESWLLVDEAVNNLILGLSAMAVYRPDQFEKVSMWVVDRDRSIGLAALRTNDNNLVLSTAEDSSHVQLLAEEVGDVPGVIGPTPCVDVFVASYGKPVLDAMEQGIYSAKEATKPIGVAGTSRLGTESDRDLLIGWVDAFQTELLGPDRARPSAHMVDVRLSGPHDQYAAWLHEVDGEPVSMSGNTGPTSNGVRVGPVYTPPEHRGKGFASALVASQTQWLLEHGRDFCFLYTDMSNPTSNAIYKRIGYRLVGESRDVRFSPNS